MKKRVLQLIGSFHQGGSERQAIALAEMLKKEGSFDVSIATLSRDGVLRSEAEAITPVIAEFRLTSFYNANFVRQVRRCARYLRDNKIDIIHTHDFHTNVFGMTAGALACVPVRVASKRETGGMRSRAQEFVERIAFSRAHAVLANSTRVRKHLGEFVAHEKVHIIYNGVDLNRFRSNGTKTNGHKSVAIVANLRHEVKNIPMFLRTAKRVAAELPETKFVIAGEGEHETQLKRAATEIGVSDCVEFIGRCVDVPSLLSSSQACVLTSRAEGFSNSILEYMAAGKPVVATNVGGADEAIVDGETGYLVASDDDEAMAKRLIEVLSNKKKSEEMGASGRKRVAEKFSADAQLAKTLALYNQLLENKLLDR